MLNLEQCKEICASGWPSNQREQTRFDAEQWLIQEVERLLNGAEPDEGFNMASDYFSKGYKNIRAENESLRRQLAEVMQSPTIYACKQMIHDKAVIEASELHRQLAEARKDAERYRWLRNKAFTEDSDGGYVKYYVLPKVCYANAADYIGHKPYCYKSLDAAIDAMSEGEKK